MIKEILSENPRVEIVNDDCLNYLKELPDNSIDCIVTDPPAGIGFMNKEWDCFNKREWGKKNEEGKNDLKVKKNFEILPRYQNYSRENFISWLQIIAKECLRVLKPGAHALVWALPKTSHWTATAWENAGFEVRDRIIHCFGSGFPKNLNIGKAVDNLLGNERRVIRKKCLPDIRGGAYGTTNPKQNGSYNFLEIQETSGNSEWEGWGTALKPAVEDWWLLRKPLEKGLNVAENVLKWGTGGININECRIPLLNEKDTTYKKPSDCKNNKEAGTNFISSNKVGFFTDNWKLGRFPSHLIIDDSEEVKSLFPNNTSRFFYCAKASRKERNIGLENNQCKEVKRQGLCGEHKNPLHQNYHPTVKPIKLMEYLIKLICPQKGIVLDPFMGSGSTGVAAVNLSRNFIGIEKEKDYFEIAKKRIEYYIKEKSKKLF